MRVRILKLGAGPGGVRQPGLELEVSTQEGLALIADKAAERLPEREVSQQAELPRPPAPLPPFENAQQPEAPEAAVEVPRGRRRRGRG